MTLGSWMIVNPFYDINPFDLACALIYFIIAIPYS